MVRRGHDDDLNVAPIQDFAEVGELSGALPFAPSLLAALSTWPWSTSHTATMFPWRRAALASPLPWLPQPIRAMPGWSLALRGAGVTSWAAASSLLIIHNGRPVAAAVAVHLERKDRRVI